MGYVVSKDGTFGVVHRRYVSILTGKPMLIIQWGPLGWLSPVNEEDCMFLKSRYESEARREAEAWLETLA